MKKELICNICGSSDVKIINQTRENEIIFYEYECCACSAVTDTKKELEKKATRLQKKQDKLIKTIEQRPGSNAEQVYELCRNSVVEIMCVNGDTCSCGTGFFISQDGYILTNAHVIMELSKEDSKIVGLADRIIGDVRSLGKSIELEFISADTALDIALLKADCSAEFAPLILHNLEPKTGADVFAIGNSKGEGICILQGIISDNNRKINDNNVIMFSATVTTGNSGGPLLSKDSNVVGMVVAGRKDTIGMNYAIPSTTLIDFIGKVKEDEEIEINIIQ